MKQTLLHSKLLMMAAAIGTLTIPGEALAHQVQTNYFLDGPAGDRLELQTTFSNGQPLKGAKVTVYAPDQPLRPQAIGRTDSQGRYSFEPNAAVSGDWEIDIKSGGHQDILQVPVTEEGVDVDLMASQGAIDQGGSDLHYASSPWAAVAGSMAIAAAAVGYARMRKDA